MLLTRITTFIDDLGVHETIKGFSSLFVHIFSVEKPWLLNFLKSRYCEKATKFEKNLPPRFEITSQSQSKMGDFFKFLWLSQNI